MSTRRQDEDAIPTAGDGGTQLDAYVTTGGSPPSCCIRDANTAQQLLDLGCVLFGDAAEAERMGEWTFCDDRAADFTLILRATPKQREYIRTHDFRLPPDPVDVNRDQTLKAPKVYGFGSLDGYAYEGDTVDAGGYVTAATGGELVGPGTHIETLTRAEATPHPDTDEQTAAAALIQAGVESAADHPAPMEDELPLETVRREVTAQDADHDQQAVEDAEPRVVPANREQAEMPTARKRIEYPQPKYGGPWGDFSHVQRDTKRSKHTTPQPIADPQDAARNQQDTHDSQWLTTKQVAVLLGITENAVTQWRKRNHIPCEVKGRRYLYRLEDVRAYVNRVSGSIERLEAEMGPGGAVATPAALEALQRLFTPWHAA